MPVTVVANDNDIFVLLLHHFKDFLADIFLLSETKTKTSYKRQLLSIREILIEIGERAARQILVVHAISGCDTTSAIYGHGKSSVWKKLLQNDTTSLTEVINDVEASHASVFEAGMKLMVLIYGGKSTDTLNHMRYIMYMSNTASSTVQQRPERLPPTESAARYHIYRVHLQVVQWISLMAANIEPTNWGWKDIEGHLVPQTTDKDAAPADILSVVRCKCKIESKRPCTTLLCSCMKHGSSCVAACKNCIGQSCGNADKPGMLHLDRADDDVNCDNIFDLEEVELIPEDCVQFDIPWLDEEVVESEVVEEFYEDKNLWYQRSLVTLYEDNTIEQETEQQNDNHAHHYGRYAVHDLCGLH